MLFQLGSQLWAFGMLDRNKILNAHGVEHLSAKTFSNDAGTDALASGVNSRRCPSRTATHDENLKRLLRCNFLRCAGYGARIQLGHDLRQVHAALADEFAVQVDRWHSHDLAGFDFVTEHCAINCHMADAWVQCGHDVDRLNDVRAILA